MDLSQVTFGGGPPPKQDDAGTPRPQDAAEAVSGDGSPVQDRPDASESDSRPRTPPEGSAAPEPRGAAPDRAPTPQPPVTDPAVLLEAPE